VAREKDPAEIIETIAQSIRVSQRGARRVRAHRFKELFGYQVLNSQRREKIERRGVLLPVAASTRNDRRLGKKDAEGNPLAAPIPVTKEAAAMLFGPVREHNAKIRRGEASRTERIEIQEQTEETDDGPDRTAEDEDRDEAAPDPA